MAGPYNNHNKGGNSSNSSSNRGRPYGLMLLLAFGAALVGVMVLQKLRERRIFNIVIKDKDTQIVSLHLALQKERDYCREVKMKHEELKAKTYPIRTQKMQLERTVVEMKSTIGSLKEELRTMETAFEEKQNETKVLSRGGGDQNDNQLVMELVVSLNHKEAEIEELKHRLEHKAWSVSADDPSNRTGNLTMSRRREVADQVSSENRNGMNFKEGETRKEVERDEETSRMEMMAKVTEKENSQEVNIRGGNTTYEGQVKSEDLKVVDHKAIGGQKIKGRHSGNLQDIENSNQKFHVKTERGMKLEMQDKGSKNKEMSRVGEKQRYLSGVKGKKWRMEKKGNLRNNGVASVRSRRFFEDDQYTTRAEEVLSNRKLTSDDRRIQAKESADSSDAEDRKDKLRHADSSDGNSSLNGKASTDTKQKQEVEKSQDHEAISIRQNQNEDMSRLEDSIDAGAQEFPRDLEVAEAEEHEDDMSEDGFFGESGFILEDNEEYEEEIDESEF